MEKEFLKKLINNYGFYMKQYRSNYSNENKYIAIKETGEGSYAVLVTDEIKENIDIYEANEYLAQISRNFSLNVIIFLKSSNEYINSNAAPNKMVIDTFGHVTWCSEKCTPLMNIFTTLGNDNREKSIIKNKQITLSIIFINVLIFLLSAYLSKNLFNIDYVLLIILGGKYGPLINKGQYFRLFTCMFLHGGITHLLCNMYSLYIVGQQIEVIYGKLKYIIIYVITGVLSSFISYIMEPEVLSVGASGAIFGLVGALLAFAYSERNKMNKKYISGLIQVTMINLIIGFTMDNIDNYAHIGGVLSGIVIGLFFYNIQKLKRSGDKTWIKKEK